MTAHPEVLVQLRNKLVADAEGFNVPEGNTEASDLGEEVKVRRSPQAVACEARDTSRTWEAPWAPDCGKV